jgi:thiol:disulfide interchange protein DsbA
MSNKKKTSKKVDNKSVNKKKPLMAKKKMSSGKMALIGGLVVAFAVSTVGFMNTADTTIDRVSIKDRSPVVFDSYVEGENFFILSEKIKDIEMDDSRLDVTKFFWYGCPHCASLEPYTSKWSEMNEDEVNMNYSHPALGNGWGAHARIYYALEKSGLVKYHKNVMRGASQNSARFTDPEVVAGLMSEEEGSRFLEAYDSNEINDMISNANSIFRKTGARGVPTILIENQIVTSPSLFPSQRAMIGMLESFKNNRENLVATIDEVSKKENSDN